jgi:hypothetical protein
VVYGPKEFAYTTSGVSQKTDNTTAITETANTSFSWKVEFNGGGLVEASSNCKEATSITINDSAN